MLLPLRCSAAISVVMMRVPDAPDGDYKTVDIAGRNAKNKRSAA